VSVFYNLADNVLSVSPCNPYYYRRILLDSVGYVTHLVKFVSVNKVIVQYFAHFQHISYNVEYLMYHNLSVCLKGLCNIFIL